jgi:hypothetical protein
MSDANAAATASTASKPFHLAYPAFRTRGSGSVGDISDGGLWDFPVSQLAVAAKELLTLASGRAHR